MGIQEYLIPLNRYQKQLFFSISYAFLSYIIREIYPYATQITIFRRRVSGLSYINGFFLSLTQIILQKVKDCPFCAPRLQLFVEELQCYHTSMSNTLACCIIFYDSAQRYKRFDPLHKVTKTKNTIKDIYV